MPKTELQKTRRAIRREELLSALLSSVTHDLKTPLAAIIGSLSSVQTVHSLSENAKKELLLTAYVEARRLDELISNILNMTKLELGGIKLEKEWHNPVEIVNRVLKSMEFKTRDSQIIMTEPEGEVRFNVDSHLIEQVIQHIVDNAVKYNEPASPIVIDIDVVEGQGIITVTNHGKAIPEKERQKIFNKFYRAVKHDKIIAGTGLGLAICKQIMQMHEGDISICNGQSKRAGGTCFMLSFPEAEETRQVLKEVAYA